MKAKRIRIESSIYLVKNDQKVEGRKENENLPFRKKKKVHTN